MNCRHENCRRKAMPSWAYCREHADRLIVGRCSRDDDPSQHEREPR